MTSVSEPEVILDRSWETVVGGQTVPSLGTDEVHVWQSSLHCSGPDLQYLHQLLSREEIERAEQFRFAYDRLTWTASRALLRLLLARYIGINPSSIALEVGRFGKPEVHAPVRRLDFSASASFDQAIWAVSLAGSVGVDIEKLDPAGTNEVAEWLLPERGATSKPSDDPQRTRAVFEAWTRREAALKVHGHGLAGETVESLRSNAKPSFGGDNDVGEWTDHVLDSMDGYVAAVSVPPGVTRIRLFRWTPPAAIAPIGAGKESLLGSARPAR